MREAAILALAGAIKQFHCLHYDKFFLECSDSSDRHVNGESLMDLSDTDEEEAKVNPVPPMSPPPSPPSIPTTSGPPPPPPPPPPPIQGVSAPEPVSQDSVGQRTMMAK